MLQKVNQKLINETKQRINSNTGLSTGFESLDRLTGGFQPGDLIVMGSRPCMGTTTFACSVVDNICLSDDKTCVFFSTESSYQGILNRLDRIHGKISCDDESYESFSKTEEDFKKASLWIDDTPAISATEMYEKCRAIQEDGHIDLVIVDNIQYFNHGEYESEFEREGMVLRELKEMAIKLKCSILALSQLKKSADRRPGGFPAVADFLNTRSIDEYVDTILLLYREKYYNHDADESSATIHIARSPLKSGISAALVYNPAYPGFQNL